MGGGGFMHHANQSLKGNRALQQKKKDLREVYRPDNPDRGEADPKKIEELSKIRGRFRAKDRLIRRITAIAFLVILIIGIAIIVYLTI